MKTLKKNNFSIYCSRIDKYNERTRERKKPMPTDREREK